jgi:putative oxidoreductase
MERSMTNHLARYAPLPLRLMLGAGMIYHGFPKLFTSQGHTEFVALLTGISIPAPEFMAWVVGLLEFFGGLALILGMFTAPVAFLLVLHQVVAMTQVHLSSGFSFLNILQQTPAGPVFGVPGYEVNLLYIAGLTSLILSGAGAWSVDEDLLIARRRLSSRETQTVITAEPESHPLRGGR